jgi:four helix bundle protein
MNEKAIILEQRLINFSICCTEIAESFIKSKTSTHLRDQLIRSSTSPALNYAEAQVAESKIDFIHKLKICLKELKESNVNLRILKAKNLASEPARISQAISESGELIAMFIASVQKAKKNLLPSQSLEEKVNS